MPWERWRVAVMLAPSIAIIFFLFFGGLIYALIVSLGWQPELGQRELSLDAYRSVLFSEQHGPVFWSGLGLSLWISVVGTALSAIGAIAAALLLRKTFLGKRLAVFLFQLNLPVPHIVAAIGILFLFSQSGLLSRVGAELGLISQPGQFPLLVRDPQGWGIILSFAWKEIPFIGIIVLAVLQSLGADYEDLARSLGASAWQRLRYVLLPLIMPSVLSASVLVFAFTFGSYEVPALLGVRYPRALPVTAVRFFRDPDLNARPEAMAISVIISLIAFVLIFTYMWISRRTIRAE
ncbi:MAG: ABC transporter permease subunit [bacterium]|nr:ABC transporter permease subunit [bacterium]